MWDSQRRVWWRADCCGHEWQDSVRARDDGTRTFSTIARARACTGPRRQRLSPLECHNDHASVATTARIRQSRWTRKSATRSTTGSVIWC
ncbi:zinc-ribbon domain-containing protein [Rhodococcus opacus]|uniref:Zinc-ribbon domain-containing protein n=1 Tax=Rhodococcus opacus TaxID=37919 RepID=A0AAX3YGD7_RHOOP|nr:MULTISPECIES: zinc-ribbon domain-containing protein [Rhodococcus]MCZ4589521.1 zinc-ribbon domain-containing protein [Rhodococcus opacus]MDI9941672.1 zinc-ribbon domain-containing protein [Rhodococcus sp. IEGM 1351]MDJ0416907.1 zinc-ribbon domain-containing protein [Rhodococcus opacus]MDV6248118.1 zinc-ribbon domain-containing protein [Rhodococcus opacus]MDX5969265.1 zinc-ribbon domain-containing protein [Rhodococcus opacus]